MTSLKDYPSQNKAFAPLMTILLFAGMILMVAATVLYDGVAMPLYIALSLWIGPGVVLTPLLYKDYAFTKIKGAPKLFVVMLFNTLSFGSILLYGVLAIDYYGADSIKISVKNFSIIETNKYGHGGVPFADITYQNYFRRIDLPGHILTEVKNYHTIQLGIAPGPLGFDVIKSRKLLK